MYARMYICTLKYVRELCMCIGTYVGRGARVQRATGKPCLLQDAEFTCVRVYVLDGQIGVNLLQHVHMYIYIYTYICIDATYIYTCIRSECIPMYIHISYVPEGPRREAVVKPLKELGRTGS